MMIVRLSRILLFILAASTVRAGPAPQPAADSSRGDRFRPLPRFENTRDLLPAPIYDERPEWVPMYWKAWELAFRNFHQPAPGSGFVSQFIDAAFNQNIFLWDTCFLTMFCNVAHPLVPGIGSLDNFYAKQHPDGEICREINRATGQDFKPWINHEGRGLFSRWGWNAFQPGTPLPFRRNAAGPPNEPVIYRGRIPPARTPVLTLDALNHPILAWAELESHRFTGDSARLVRVYGNLTRYFEALRTHLRQGNGLYITDWASMDDSPRNPLLRNGGTGVDISCEMVLFARSLGRTAELTGRIDEAARWRGEADELAGRINALMWDPDREFYFDLTLEGERTTIKTIAGFWALVAGVASPAQARSLVRQLENTATFKRLHRVPTVAADEPTYMPTGYWRGGVWAPTEVMVIRGLERNGFEALAREIALNHLDVVGRVFEATGTFWENYAADAVSPGTPSRKDFVGWTGLGPILLLLEHAIGLKPDAPANRLLWTIHGAKRQGCERFRFNGHVVSLLAEPDGTAGGFRLEVESDGEFELRLEQGERLKTVTIRPGKQQLEF